MTDISDEELRKAILSIDTTYKVDKDTTTEFLLPGFYLDRLIGFIQGRIEAAVRSARIEGYDSSRSGCWVFISNVNNLQNLEDLYWSYVAEYMADFNKPYTKEGDYRSEIKYFQNNMPYAGFDKVGVHKRLAFADQKAKERTAQLQKSKEVSG